MAFPTVWFWRGNRLNDQWFDVARFTSDRWPHPTLIEDPIFPDDDSLVTTVSLDLDGHLVVDTSREEWLAGAPNLWYALIPENSGITATYALVAYDDGVFPTGTIVHPSEFKPRGLAFGGFVGAIRWRQESSIMEQIYVPEEHRRKRISSKLISIADTVIVALGSNMFMTGGETTTADGEKLREVWSESKRVRDRKVISE